MSFGRESHEMDVKCPECGEKGKVLWFPRLFNKYSIKGSTGASSSRVDYKTERVEGKCEKCGYTFKSDDL